MSIVQSILAGEVTFSSHGKILLGNPVDWSRLGKLEKNLEFRLHSFRWARPLLQSRDDRTISYWDDILLRWHAAYGDINREFGFALWERLLPMDIAARISNFRKTPAREKALWFYRLGPWNDHATAQRALEITERIKLGNYSPELYEIAKSHLSLLKRKDFFRCHHNHGLQQTQALFELGHALQDSHAMTLAEGRFEDHVQHTVNEDGVLNEQSTAYQGYSLRILQQMLASFQTKNVKVSPFCTRRIELMEWLIHCSRLSSGAFISLGDGGLSGTYEPMKLKPVDAPTSMPNHEIIEAEDLRIDVFKDEFLFVRHWGNGRDKLHNFHFALALQAKRALHGHEDGGAPVLYWNGQPILLAFGLYRYGVTNANRTHNREREGQNTIVPLPSSDIKTFRFRNAQLEDLSINNGQVTFTYRAYSHKYEWRRHFSINPAEGIIRIEDHFDGSFDTLYRFDPSLTTDITPGKFCAHNEKIKIEAVWNDPSTQAQIFKGSEEPMLGWHSPSYGEFKSAPVLRHTWQNKASLELRLALN